jgi:anti-sigma factor RsiW
MSMTPIVQAIQGQSLTFLLPSAPLNAATRAELVRTLTLWADTVEASSPAAMSAIPPIQIRTVLAAALVGGGMDDVTATDTAERILRNQNNRAVDFLAAQIVRAAIAASAEVCQ